ncbi:MAG: hypothetical protein ACREQJ_16015 [Candidatus Binatia bacterium]
MNFVTVIWTVVTVAFAAFAATGGGHPPGAILVPFAFAAWLAGALAAEGVARWRDPRRSIRRPLVFVATAAPLFVAAGATGLWLKASRHGMTMEPAELAWYVALGPMLLAVTLASLWQLRRGGRGLANVLLIGSALALVWLAWESKEWLPGSAMLLGLAALQLAAAKLRFAP